MFFCAFISLDTVKASCQNLLALDDDFSVSVKQTQRERYAQSIESYLVFYR